MILTDILEVIYAPQKVFKRIVANPKYLGVILILLLFVGLQLGYIFGQFSKIELEQTHPVGGIIQTFTNSTSWTATSDVNITNNLADYYNNTVFVANLQRPPNDPLGYYSLFGNFSLQLDVTDTKSFSVSLFNTSNVDCSGEGFKNLTLGLKLIQPKSAPQNTTLTLYSLADSNYFTYDLTSALADASVVNQWGEVVIPLGPDVKGWSETGNPQWNNITSLSLQFDYSNSQDVTIRIGALFFGGLYMTPMQYDSVGLLMRFLQVYALQFLFTWLFLTGLIYLICRGLKNTVLWKPLFIAMGFAMVVMVIRAVVSIAASAVLSVIYYPFDISFGTIFDPLAMLYYPAEAVSSLLPQSQVSIVAIDAMLSVFSGIITIMFAVSYAWLGALGTFVIKELKPEFSTIKCAVIAAVSVCITLLLLWLLIGVV
ncbi:MAG: hypothetical protein LBQ98_07800 [Nitrososphaerota archaeon]|nr:hypothetical protein [Nitrososphaerota archaeon]